ncbi:hypothetical protein RCZ04_07680 [Capnocytophaga sp. HP1101]
MANEITLPLVRNEADVRTYYEGVNEQIALFQLEQQRLGSHTYYRWQAQMKEDVVFEGRMDIPSLRLYFVTQTRKGLEIDIDDRIYIAKAGTHNIFFGREECLGKDVLHQGDTIEVITLAISAEQFLQMANIYPEAFMDWYERYERGGNFVLAEHSLPINFAMQTALAQLQQAPLLGKAARPYADLKVQELLLLQLQQIEAQQEKVFQYCKTQNDIQKMYEVRDRITAQLDATPSIAELARAVGVNEKKLCYGFKEVFGTTVFGYLFDYKMQLAQQLLLHSDKNIGEIALACGYDYVSHFSSAFKKKFGSSPKQVAGKR